MSHRVNPKRKSIALNEEALSELVSRNRYVEVRKFRENKILWRSRKNMHEELGEHLRTVTRNVGKLIWKVTQMGTEAATKGRLHMAVFLNEKTIQTLQKDNIKKIESTKCLVMMWSNQNSHILLVGV